MPYAPKTPCAYPGCPELTTGRFCDEHARDHRRTSDKRRGSSSERGYNARWQRARKQFLKENPVCAICADTGLFTAVTVVDHIVPHRGDKTLFWDKSNWQALCVTCHNRKTAGEEGGFGNNRHEAETQQVTIICGPPGSGKTTYVRERSLWGDLVVDLDALFSAMTGLPWYDKPANLVPFIHDLREAIYQMIGQGGITSRVWIITSGAKASDREFLRKRFNADVILCAVPPLECKNRIRNDERRRDRAAQWETIVDGWWRTYERSNAREAGHRIITGEIQER